MARHSLNSCYCVGASFRIMHTTDEREIVHDHDKSFFERPDRSAAGSILRRGLGGWRWHGAASERNVVGAKCGWQCAHFVAKIRSQPGPGRDDTERQLRPD